MVVTVTATMWHICHFEINNVRLDCFVLVDKNISYPLLLEVSPKQPHLCQNMHSCATCEPSMHGAARVTQ